MAIYCRLKGIVQVQNGTERRTSADDVFDFLHAQINTLKLLPGTRISEVEIARQFDVSRQPVREAFIKLANRDLLLIRPQKATIVRRFSNENILRARFTRFAIETEVIRRAVKKTLGQFEGRLERSLEAQKRAVAEDDIDRFHSLDYDFHKMLCALAGSTFIFETIAESKAQVDRLCMLSLSQPTAMDELYQDHVEIVKSLKENNEAMAIETIKHHLSRLDTVVEAIRKSHSDYFDD